MKHPDVLYCIEHVGREMAIATAVRHLARVRHQIDVEVISLPHHARFATDRFRPRLLAVPGFLSRRGYGANAHLERFRDVPVLNLAIEQLLSDGNRKFRMPRDPVSREDILHVAAGEFYRDWLLASGVPPDNVLLIGSLPCQLYRPPYRQYFQVSRERLASLYGLMPDKPWVLFPENFSAAFLTRSHVRHRLRHGYDERELSEYIEFSRRSFEELMRWCGLAAREGHVELIVRPRPAMPQESFVAAARAAMGTIPKQRLHFIKEGDVRSWVLAADLVVSSFSTVLVEAAAAQRFALLLRPLPIPRPAWSAWHDLSPGIATREEFLDVLQNVPTLPYDGRLEKWTNETLLNQGDAIANLTQVLADIVQGRRSAPTIRRPAWRTIVWDHFRDEVKKGERFVRQLVRPGRRAHFGHEADHFDASDVDAATSRWANVLEGCQESQAA